MQRIHLVNSINVFIGTELTLMFCFGFFCLIFTSVSFLLNSEDDPLFANVVFHLNKVFPVLSFLRKTLFCFVNIRVFSITKSVVYAGSIAKTCVNIQPGKRK